MNIKIKVEIEGEGVFEVETKPLTFTILRFMQENVKHEEIPIELIEQIIDKLILKVKTPDDKEYTTKDEIKENIPFNVYIGVFNGLSQYLTQKKMDIKLIK